MTSHIVGPGIAERWRQWRVPVAIALLIVLGGLTLAVIQSGSRGGPLDPRSAQQPGARALAVLLKDRGVDVDRTRTLASTLDRLDDDTMLVVTHPSMLTHSHLRKLARAPSPHVVLLEPDEDTLTAFAPGVVPAGDAFPRTREPGCALREATRAGSVRAEGPTYRAPAVSRAVVCYGDGTRGALVRVPDALIPGSERTRVVDAVGTASSFTNARLADEGNAALALNLLGSRARLVWYVPSPADLPAPGSANPQAPPDVLSLLPEPVRFGLAQVAVAIALLMLARARRLGPVVTEPLPVAVRASETVEGLARLYHRARARDRAAAALRDATRARLTSLLGLPRQADLDAVARAAADRTGRPPAEVARLLGGAVDQTTGGSSHPATPPSTVHHAVTDDAALVRLADDLDTLEQEVRRS
jgi:hypothetical protein